MEILLAAIPVPGPGRIVVTLLTRDALLIVGKVDELEVETRDDDSEGGFGPITHRDSCQLN